MRLYAGFATPAGFGEWDLPMNARLDDLDNPDVDEDEAAWWAANTEDMGNLGEWEIWPSQLDLIHLTPGVQGLHAYQVWDRFSESTEPRLYVRWYQDV